MTIVIIVVYSSPGELFGILYVLSFGFTYYCGMPFVLNTLVFVSTYSLIYSLMVPGFFVGVSLPILLQSVLVDLPIVLMTY